MRLIFVTQVLDRGDGVLGFVVRWVEGLAARCERVRVIALEVGEVDSLPGNVDFRQVGRRGRVRRFLRYRRHLREAFGEGFDTLLTHMVPRYSTLAAPLARRAGAGHFLWYTHKGVDRRLRRAVRVVDRVFSASPESMRVDTPKRVITGHGVDLAHFAAGAAPSQPPRLLSVGRLSPAKDPLTLLDALALVRAGERGRELVLDWVGGGLAAGDDAYEREVARRIEERGLAGCVALRGPIPYGRVAEFFSRATLFLSGSRTGSVDKVVLEAMAAGRPVVTCNESFPPILAELGCDAQALVYPPGDAHALAERIEGLLALTQEERDRLGARLRAIVARDHEVDALMGRLVTEMAAGDHPR